MFCNPKQPANAFPLSCLAEQYRSRHYNLLTFTPAILYPDYALQTTTGIDTQTAVLGPDQGAKKAKRTSATEIERNGD